MKSHHVDGDANEHRETDKESGINPRQEPLPNLIQQQLTHGVQQKLLLVGGDKAREKVRTQVTRRLL